MRALGYARRSRSEAGHSVFAIESQAAEIEAYCAERGWEVVDVVGEDASFNSPPTKRSSLLDAITRVGEGEADVLVVSRVDRIGLGPGNFHFLGYLAERGRHFVALDAGWDTATPGGAEAARLFLHLADQSIWQANTAETPRWNGRNEVLAKHIEPGSAVLDLGSGAQTLRELLPPDCHYQPCDLVDAPDVLRCDFNQDLWPVLPREYDVAVVSGVIEYLHDPVRFLERVPTLADRVILTHVYRNEGAPRPRGPSWATHMTRSELEATFDEIGIRWEKIDQWNRHGIYELRRPVR
jgi:hypothetical protein